MGPKYGVTHARVLKTAGIDVDVSVDGAVANIESHGWSYVDQSQFCPSLFGLKDLRTEMVKRPVITTVEVLAGPIGTSRNTPYDRIRPQALSTHLQHARKTCRF